MAVCGAARRDGRAGCGRQDGAAPAEDELPTLSVTHWTEKTELFMEYPVLVAGRKSLFAVHLTTMADFKPVSRGTRRRSSSRRNGWHAAKTLVGPQPSRPGAFRVEDTPPAPGRYRWALVVEGPELSDRHDLGSITVFADEQRRKSRRGTAASRRSGSHRIPERAAMDERFATTPVRETEVRDVRPRTRDGASAAGRRSHRRRASGRPVRADVLLSIGDRVRTRPGAGVPRTAARGRDRSRHAGSRRRRGAGGARGRRVEQARADRLLAERAVPARRVEDARRGGIGRRRAAPGCRSPPRAA